MCGQCGSWYGSKTWHAGSKYEKRIWRCNHKYAGKMKCTTPHLTDQQIKDTFAEALRQLAAKRSAAVDVEPLVLKRFNTNSLEAQEQALAGQIGAAATAIEDLIIVNARQPLNQDEYQTRFNALAEQHERLLAEHKNIAGQITDLQTRHKAYEHYQHQLAQIEDEGNVKYSPFRWHALLDHAEVGTDGTITYVFRDRQGLFYRRGDRLCILPQLSHKLIFPILLMSVHSWVYPGTTII